MGHVGEVVHLDSIELFLRCLGFFGLFPFAALLADMAGCFSAHPADMPPESIADPQQQQSQGSPKQDGPPAGVPGRQHLHPQERLGFHNGIAVVVYLYPETVVPGGQIGIIGFMYSAGRHPVFVEALHHIVVVGALVAAVIQGGEGDAETVLLVLEGDIRTVFQFGGYGAFRSGPHQLVVDGQVLEDQGDGTLLGNVQRVEPGETVRSAEHQGAVRIDAGGAVAELIAANPVFLVVIHESSQGTVPFPEPVERGYPDVPLAVFLDGGDVLAADALDQGGGSAFPVPVHQSVGDGAQPYVPGGILVQAVRDADRPADAGGFLFRSERQFTHFVGVIVDREHGQVERAHQNLARLRGQKVGHEGPLAAGSQGDGLHLPGALVIDQQVRSHGADPDAAPVVLGDGEGRDGDDTVRGNKAQAVPAAAEHLEFVCKQQPVLSLGIHEHFVASDVSHLVVLNQIIYRDRADAPFFPVIDKHAVPLGGDPEQAVRVQAQRSNAFVVKEGGEKLIAVELVLVVIGDGVSLVCCAEPDVVPAVLEDGADFCIGHIVGESGLSLADYAVLGGIIAEQACSDDIQQDHGPVVGREQLVDISFHDLFSPGEGFGDGFGLERTGVDDAEASHAGKPDLTFSHQALMIDKMGRGEFCQLGEIVRAVDAQGGAVAYP